MDSKLHTPETLIAFRERVKAAFIEKRIPAPIHLPGGNEQQVIDVFNYVRPGDWVFSGWRSMYHALLHGIPEEALFDMILAGRSMYIMSREYRFMASSIVGGILPIACGIAMAIKRMKGDERVFVFVGDMTESIGLFDEFRRYAYGWELPVKIVVEDNGFSTGTPTWQAWSNGNIDKTDLPVEIYSYTRTTPHVGVGQRIEF